MAEITYENCDLPADFAIAEGVQRAIFYRVNFATWPALPSSLTELYLDSCDISDGSPIDLSASSVALLHVGRQAAVPSAFPATMTWLSLYRVFFAGGLPALPATLVTVRMVHVYAPSWPVAWPSATTSIYLYSVGMEAFPPAWPSVTIANPVTTLEKVHVEQMYLADIPAIPDTDGTNWLGPAVVPFAIMD